MTREELSERLSTKEGRTGVVAELITLTENDGWRLLCFYLEDASKSLQAKINDINNMSTEKELQNDRIRLYYIDKLLGMPRALASQIEQTTEDVVITEVY